MNALNTVNKLMTTDIELFAKETKKQKIVRLQKDKDEKEQSLKDNPELMEIYESYEKEIEELVTLKSKLVGEGSKEQLTDINNLMNNLKKEQSYVFQVKNEELAALLKELEDKEKKYSQDNDLKTDMVNTVGALSTGVKGALKNLKYARVSTYATIAVREGYRASTGSSQAYFGMREKSHLKKIAKNLEQIEDIVILEEREEVLNNIIALEEKLNIKNEELLELEKSYKEKKGKRSLFSKVKNITGMAKDEDKEIVELQKVIKELEDKKDLTNKEFKLYEEKILTSTDLLIEQKKQDMENKKVFELENIQQKRKDILADLGLINEGAIEAFIEKHKEAIAKYEKSAKVAVDVAAVVYGVYRIGNAATILPDADIDFSNVQDIVKDVTKSITKEELEEKTMEVAKPSIDKMEEILPDIEQIDTEKPVIDPNAEEIAKKVDEDLENDKNIKEKIELQHGEDWNIENAINKMEEILHGLEEKIKLENEQEEVLTKEITKVIKENMDIKGEMSKKLLETEEVKMYFVELRKNVENSVQLFKEIDILDIKIEENKEILITDLAIKEEEININKDLIVVNTNENIELMKQKQALIDRIEILMNSKNTEGLTLEEYAKIDEKIINRIADKDAIDIKVEENIDNNHKLDIKIKEDLEIRETMDDSIQAMIEEKKILLEKVKLDEKTMLEIKSDLESKLNHEIEMKENIITEVEPGKDYGPIMEEDAKEMKYKDFLEKYEKVIQEELLKEVIKSEYIANDLSENLFALPIVGNEEREAAYKLYIQTHTYEEVSKLNKILSDSMLGNNSVLTIEKGITGIDNQENIIKTDKIDDIKASLNVKSTIVVEIDKAGQLRGINEASKILGLPEMTHLEYEKINGKDIDDVKLSEMIIRNIIGTEDNVTNNVTSDSGMTYNVVDTGGETTEYKTADVFTRTRSEIS
jgi:hypothetical protein